MSEFPAWVEREIGWREITYQESRIVHDEIRSGDWPDPRGTKQVIWWRQVWPFDRRKCESP